MSHSNAWDYSLAGIGAAALVVELGILQPIRPPLRWRAPILFDTDVRNALRVSDEHTRHNIELVGWALWGAQLALPVLVDVPYAWSRYGYGMARDLFWQDAVTLTLAGAADGALRDLVGRARPGVYDCLAQGGAHCLDADSDTTRSFPGGHIVNSTAASVLTCTQHYYTRLYGGPWDGVACVTTLTSDLTLAVLRIVSDNHWVSDQIAGVAIGGLIGWGVPYVMHFRRGARVRIEGDRPAKESQSPSGALVVPMPIMVEHGAGLGLAGIY
ncbi:MAG: phosphatase PAP2 family protein [Myxococcota bacterium]|nr:phosphatase PAP2 family protein [Myxococcota bacterium]